MIKQLSSRSGPALHYLWRHSALAGHPRAGNAYDGDRNTLDSEPLTDPTWAYSSGESVLIDLALCLADAGTLNLADLRALDEPNRAVAISAIRLWLCGDVEAVTL